MEKFAWSRWSWLPAVVQPTNKPINYDAMPSLIYNCALYMIPVAAKAVVYISDLTLSRIWHWPTDTGTDACLCDHVYLVFFPRIKYPNTFVLKFIGCENHMSWTYLHYWTIIGVFVIIWSVHLSFIRYRHNFKYNRFWHFQSRICILYVE